MNSYKDAGCEVEWRLLPGVGHFVSLEAPGKLALEIRRALSPTVDKPTELDPMRTPR